MDKKIKNWKDYIKPQNLALLRRCNIKYREALRYFKKQKWKNAREAYKEFTKINLIDYDAFYELGKCCLELGNMEVNNLKKQKSRIGRTKQKEIQKKINKYFTECDENWSKARRIEPENQKLQEELIKAKEQRKKNRGVA